MRLLRNSLLLLPVAAIALARPADALRKCSNSNANSIWRLEVDGQIVGAYKMGEKYDEKMAPPETIETLHIVCVQSSEAFSERPGEISVVTIATRMGDETRLRSHLDRLVERQEGYKKATGRYADTVDKLGLFDARVPVPITMRIEGTGWSATASLPDEPIACHVAVGSASPPMPEMHRGIVRCAVARRATEEE